MPFKTADQGKANAANDINNCQLCAPVLLARFRGVNITAITYKEGGFMERLANNMQLAFEKMIILLITNSKRNVIMIQ